ncbi:protein FAR1-RELATED SEQUENCE 12-like [Arachis stenosperma]|uniref:protein FAR1-RELATED SEQUENCE 12-like n=1 Tax=Arachis stenosperma TaxID=217475 RepID=UPI0025ACAEB4|nr:protein FAR1-RELATED SEQUENCE 12-like [Arachis stenosperma]
MKYVDYLPADRKIFDVDIAHMESMRHVGISIPKIYESIVAQAGGFNLVPFTKRDMYNEVRRQKAMQNGDVNAALRVLEGAAQTDEKLYWSITCMGVKKFTGILGGKAPTAVITDGYRSMRVAIQEVLPNAHHRLCAWHLLKNATVNEFEMLWNAMLEECGVRKLEWVKDIYEKKSSWTTVYIWGRDNEEELDFRLSYGTPVLQTLFPELEKSRAINFTREIFSRYRESL